MHITWCTSLEVCSGQLHNDYLTSDAPGYNERKKAAAFLHLTLQKVQMPQRRPMLVVTGSSASSLLKLAQQAFGLDEASDCLTHEDLLRCQGLLDALPARDIARHYKQNIERARVLPAGALLLQNVMEWLQLSEIQTTPHSLRYDILLAYARYSGQWLIDRLTAYYQ